MALTSSKMMPLGTKAPTFSLMDVTQGKDLRLEQLRGEIATLVMFICNHCPFVKHINSELSRLGRDYSDKGVGIIAIASNDVVNYPDDSPENLKTQANSFGFSFPYLYDETQEVAKIYDAACTPDFFLFNSNLALEYRGQLDDSRPGNGLPVTGKDLRAAINALLNDEEVSSVQKPSIGCNIKWK
ncbi:MAG: thioredoxin family protein [Bacteroidota bacterium]